MGQSLGEDDMDTTRWKSILVPREMYIDVKETAKREGRTISGQLCYAYEQFKGEPLPRPEDIDSK